MIKIDSELYYNQAVLETLVELSKNTLPDKFFHTIVILSEFYRKGYVINVYQEVLEKIGIRNSLDYLVNRGFVLKIEIIDSIGERTQKKISGYRADISRIFQINEFLSERLENGLDKNY